MTHSTTSTRKVEVRFMAVKWVLFVILSASVSCTYQQLWCEGYFFFDQEYSPDPRCSEYYKIFEHALLSDPNTLWILQQMLIQENLIINCVDFYIDIEAKTKCNVTFKPYTRNITVIWRLPEDPSHSLSDIFNIYEVAGLDISFISRIIIEVTKLISDPFQIHSSSYNLKLFLNELSCSTNWSDVFETSDVLSSFLKWVSKTEAQ